MPAENVQKTQLQQAASDKQSTHSDAVQASAVFLIRLLRETYPEVNIKQLENTTSDNKDNKDIQQQLINYLASVINEVVGNNEITFPEQENLKGAVYHTAVVANKIATSEKNSSKDKKSVLEKMRSIANTAPGFAWADADRHWSTNSRYNDKSPAMEQEVASPAETLNLVCRALLDKTRFQAPKPGSSFDEEEAHRIDSLYGSLLDMQQQEAKGNFQFCASARQHEPLFLLNHIFLDKHRDQGGKPISLPTDTLSFLLDSLSEFVKTELGKLTKEKQSEILSDWILYQADLIKRDIPPVISFLRTQYETAASNSSSSAASNVDAGWQTACKNYLRVCLAENGIDPKNYETKLADYVGNIEALQAPAPEAVIMQAILQYKELNPGNSENDFFELITKRNSCLKSAQETIKKRVIEIQKNSQLFEAEELFQQIYQDSKKFGLCVGKPYQEALATMKAALLTFYTTNNFPEKNQFEQDKFNYARELQKIKEQAHIDFIKNFFIDDNETHPGSKWQAFLARQKREERGSFALSNFTANEAQELQELAWREQIDSVEGLPELFYKIQSISTYNDNHIRSVFASEEIRLLKKFLNKVGCDRLSAKVLEQQEDRSKHPLFITDEQLLQWKQNNTISAGGSSSSEACAPSTSKNIAALDVSSYEINRIFLHALLVKQEQWSKTFTDILSVVIQWLAEPISDKDSISLCAIKKTRLKDFFRLAATNGHCGVISELLKANISVNEKLTADNMTPLYAAASYGQLEAVKMLIDANANINCGRNQLDTTVTPLFIAAQNGYTAVVETLLDAIKKSTPNDYHHIVCPMNGFIPAIKKKIESNETAKKEFDKLLKRFSIRGNYIPHFSTLHVAIVFGHADIVAMLEKLSPPVDYNKNASITTESLKLIFMPKLFDKDFTKNNLSADLASDLSIKHRAIFTILESMGCNIDKSNETLLLKVKKHQSPEDLMNAFATLRAQGVKFSENQWCFEKFIKYSDPYSFVKLFLDPKDDGFNFDLTDKKHVDLFDKIVMHTDPLYLKKIFLNLKACEFKFDLKDKKQIEILEKIVIHKNFVRLEKTFAALKKHKHKLDSTNEQKMKALEEIAEHKDPLRCAAQLLQEPTIWEGRRPTNSIFLLAPHTEVLSHVDAPTEIFVRYTVDDRRKDKVKNLIKYARMADQHPNILMPLLAIQGDDGSVEVDMEFADAGPLMVFLPKFDPASRVTVALCIVRQILHAMLYMETVHGKLHRNINPRTVLLRIDGCVKLDLFDNIDPQTARENPDIYFANDMPYCAPECRDASSPDKLLQNAASTTDVWSVGTLILAIVWGVPLRPRDKPSRRKAPSTFVVTDDDRAAFAREKHKFEILVAANNLDVPDVQTKMIEQYGSHDLATTKELADNMWRKAIPDDALCCLARCCLRVHPQARITLDKALALTYTFGGVTPSLAPSHSGAAAAAVDGATHKTFAPTWSCSEDSLLNHKLTDEQQKTYQNICGDKSYGSAIHDCLTKKPHDYCLVTADNENLMMFDHPTRPVCDKVLVLCDVLVNELQAWQRARQDAGSRRTVDKVMREVVKQRTALAWKNLESAINFARLRNKALPAEARAAAGAVVATQAAMAAPNNDVNVIQPAGPSI